MANFTPGPWELIKHARFPYLREVKSQAGYICDMEGLSADDMPTVEGNATLIAAAPDMYAALKAMVNDDAFAELCQGIGEAPGWLLDGHIALAKAEGGAE